MLKYYLYRSNDVDQRRDCSPGDNGIHMPLVCSSIHDHSFHCSLRIRCGQRSCRWPHPPRIPQNTCIQKRLRCLNIAADNRHYFVSIHLDHGTFFHRQMSRIQGSIRNDSIRRYTLVDSHRCSRRKYFSDDTFDHHHRVQLRQGMSKPPFHWLHYKCRSSHRCRLHKNRWKRMNVDHWPAPNHRGTHTGMNHRYFCTCVCIYAFQWHTHHSQYICK